MSRGHVLSARLQRNPVVYLARTSTLVRGADDRTAQRYLTQGRLVRDEISPSE
jgi:hypothetical protein